VVPEPVDKWVSSGALESGNVTHRELVRDDLTEVMERDVLRRRPFSPNRLFFTFFQKFADNTGAKKSPLFGDVMTAPGTAMSRFVTPMGAARCFAMAGHTWLHA